ncbi:MAG: S1 RNA-binding domain-containing protein [Anaerolineales bacterium]
MVVAIKHTLKEDALATPDESWWESVLAEEERIVSLAPEKQSAAKAAEKVNAQESASQPEQPDWDYAMSIYKQDQIVALTVSGYNRGGLLVEGERLNGFVPYSHLVEMTCEVEAQRESFLAKFSGKEIRLKVIECIPDEGRIVFSERAARADAGTRTQIFTSLQPGQVVSGEVTNVTDFGVFVDLGGVEGLIHISELSWGRVVHPSHILKLGETTKVQVIDIIPERCRIALSLKRLHSNPWETAKQRFAINDIFPATITSVVSFGVFARLEDGLEGLVHASEIDLPEGTLIRNAFKSGETIHVRILHIEPENQRLGLSMKLDNA